MIWAIYFTGLLCSGIAVGWFAQQREPEFNEIAAIVAWPLVAVFFAILLGAALLVVFPYTLGSWLRGRFNNE